MQLKGELISVVLIISFLIFSSGCGSSDTTDVALDPTDDTFTVFLQGINGAPDDQIKIPNGRPIYAILISGYSQNGSFDMFHYYKFADCLLKQGAYVHYSWWNNLLAPYMEKPLHNLSSEPGSIPDGDFLGFLPIFDPLNIIPDKAIPADDFQFQADAEALLIAIRKYNPHAAIVLVGHSMGGEAVARLGATTNVDIDLLAPIDPVGNRNCTPWFEGADFPKQCQGLVQWTRFRATHKDWFILPPRRAFGNNIKYLYHRWQQEFMPPTDYTCPPGGNILPCGLPLALSDYLFIHPDTHATSIHAGSTNVQSIVGTDLLSGFDISPANLFGGIDGHGEIVGFRGFDVFTLESIPVALRARNWPTDSATRVSHLKAWDKDSNYLDDNNHAPENPALCMVSEDLCTIVNSIINLPPSADAGPDQTVECSNPNGTLVTLDGSGSTDPNGDPLTFTWDWPDGTMMGEIMQTYLPVGTHSFALTVDDGRGKTDTDTVDITVMDTTPPSLSVSLSPDVLWPPNHKLVSIAASIQVSDTCDESPNVELVSITSNEADNGAGDGNTSDDIQEASFGTDDRTFLLRAERAGKGSGRIYTVTYGATDASGNIAKEATAEATVLHNQNKKRK